MSMSSNAHASLKDRLRDQAYCIQSQTLRDCRLLTFKALLPSSDHERYLEMGILLSFENGRESLKLKTRQVYPHGMPNNLKEYLGLPFSTFLSQHFSILFIFLLLEFVLLLLRLGRYIIMECQIIWKRICASGLPIPDILILGDPIIPVQYCTQIFQSIVHRVSIWIVVCECH